VRWSHAPQLHPGWHQLQLQLQLRHSIKQPPKPPDCQGDHSVRTWTNTTHAGSQINGSLPSLWGCAQLKRLHISQTPISSPAGQAFWMFDAATAPVGGLPNLMALGIQGTGNDACCCA